MVSSFALRWRVLRARWRMLVLPEFNQQLERRMPVTSVEPVAKKAKSGRRPSGHFEDSEHTA